MPSPTLYGAVPGEGPDVAWDDSEPLTVSTAVLQIPANLRGAHDAAFITCDDQTVRVRVDGGDPTAAVGHRLKPDDLVLLTGRDELKEFRMIRQDASDATLTITVGVRLP